MENVEKYRRTPSRTQWFRPESSGTLENPAGGQNQTGTLLHTVPGFVLVAILAAVYFLAGKLGLMLAFVHVSATAIWPPAGIALAALLIFGYRLWPGVFLGAFFVNLTTAGTLWTSLAIASGNTLEGLAGAYLFQRYASGAFNRAPDVFKFALLAGLLSTAISATVGSTSLFVAGFIPAQSYDMVWLTWWLGDAGGVLIVAPPLMVGRRLSRIHRNKLYAAEIALCFAALLINGELVFGALLPFADNNYPLAFLPVLPLVWAGVRFGQREATLGVFMLSLIAILGTLAGFGPFAQGSRNEALLWLQAFNGIMAVMALTVATIVTEQKRAEERLQKAHAELETRVRERTAELAHSNEELRQQIAIREQTESALRESQNRFEMVARATNDAIWDWNLETDGVWWNPGITTLFGYASNAVRPDATWWCEHIHPEDRERVVARIHSAIRSGEQYWTDEYRYLRADGSAAFVFDRGFVLHNEQGKPVRMIGAMVDISKMKRSEDALERTLTRLRSLYDINSAITSSLELGTILNRLLGKISVLLPNPAITVRLFNETTGRLEPVECWNLPKTEWLKTVTDESSGNSMQALKAKTPVAIENLEASSHMRYPEFIRRNNLVSYLGIPLIIKEEILGIMSLYTREPHKFNPEEIDFFHTVGGKLAIALHNARFYDRITKQASELAQANENLRKREEIQKFLKEFSQDITVLELDELLRKLTGKVRELLSVDISDVRVLEGEAGRVLGTSGIAPDLLPAVRDRSKRRWQWYTEHRTVLSVRDLTEQTGHVLEGSRIGRIGVRGYVGAPMFSRTGELLGVLRALTYQPRTFSEEEKDLLQQLANETAIAIENAKLYDNLKTQAIELEKANKGKNEFLSVISHELRTPLNVILGYTGMLRDEMIGTLSQEQKRALEKIVNRSKDLLHMVNGMLQATQIEAHAVKVNWSEVNLSSLLNDLRSAYSFPSGKTIRFEWDYSSQLPAVITDQEKLQQILQNLLSNAVKFTDQGCISVSAQLSPQEDQLVFKVTDTGVGIPPEKLPFIFEMFRQVDSSETRPFEGVGLGLYIVKKYTELLGGTIEVESVHGSGTSFTLSIPARA